LVFNVNGVHGLQQAVPSCWSASRCEIGPDLGPRGRGVFPWDMTDITIARSLSQGGHYCPRKTASRPVCFAADEALDEGAKVISTPRPSCGGIAQLVERLVRNEKVRGSNPLTSTNSGLVRGHSSIGRAPALQAGGQGFESPCLHHSGGGGRSRRKPEGHQEFLQDEPTRKVKPELANGRFPPSCVFSWLPGLLFSSL
jgi:hypothetical protein